VPRGFLRDQQQAKHVEIEMLVEVFGRDAIQGCELVEPGIVDEDVDRTERLHGRGHDFFHIAGVGEIAVHGSGFAALGGDRCDHALGRRFAGAVVDGDRRTLGGEANRDLGADTLGCAGYQRHFAFKSPGHLAPISLIWMSARTRQAFYNSVIMNY
jgi:hypothetical protein